MVSILEQAVQKHTTFLKISQSEYFEKFRKESRSKQVESKMNEKKEPTAQDCGFLECKYCKKIINYRSGQPHTFWANSQRDLDHHIQAIHPEKYNRKNART